MPQRNEERERKADSIRRVRTKRNDHRGRAPGTQQSAEFRCSGTARNRNTENRGSDTKRRRGSDANFRGSKIRWNSAKKNRNTSRVDLEPRGLPAWLLFTPLLEPRRRGFWNPADGAFGTPPPGLLEPRPRAFLEPRPRALLEPRPRAFLEPRPQGVLGTPPPQNAARPTKQSHKS